MLGRAFRLYKNANTKFPTMHDMKKLLCSGEPVPGEVLLHLLKYRMCSQCEGSCMFAVQQHLLGPVQIS